MPKATAVWLVDNTSLSFYQIGAFCKLHPLEVKAIADGDAAQGIKGLDPISTGQLTREELETGQNDPNHKLKLAEPKVNIPTSSKRRGPRYTPVSRRQDRPNAILWLLRNHPEMRDAQIIRLVGTTKTTIQAIRERSHWNSANLSPVDPVSLALCAQLELDLEVQKAAKYAPAPENAEVGETLLPASETTTEDILASFSQTPSKPDKLDEIDAEAVFANLGSLNKSSEEDEAEAPEAEEASDAESSDEATADDEKPAE
jgi:hypothetical protein